MHLADLSKGILGANGVVGASLGLGCGAGLAARHAGDGRVAVAYFGDGASNQGLFHEALKLADVIIDETYPHGQTLDTIKTAYLLDSVPTADLPQAIVDGRVYTLDGTMDYTVPS